MRLTPADIRSRKRATPIVTLTAYTAPIARILDAHADILLVGDSLGMVVYGLPDTLGVTLEQMIWHGRAVVDASSRACVVVDMPYGSYESAPDIAIHSARRIIHETGAQAVKLEGGVEIAEIIRRLVAQNIPVIAHIGLLPQRVRQEGGYKIQGKDEASVRQLLSDAQAVEQAGAFAVVIEGVKETAARQISEAVAIPTIGIGASAACDGQVLVIDDMLGLTEKTAKFVRRYANLRETIDQAATAYAQDVKTRHFPASAETY